MRPSVFKALDEYNRKQADFAAWCERRGIAMDDWITLSGRDANGDKHGGARVLLDDDGAIVYGLGGGHAGKKLGEALTDIKRDAAAQRGQGTLFSDFKSQARKERKQAQAERKERQKQEREKRREERKAVREAQKKAEADAKQKAERERVERLAQLKNELREQIKKDEASLPRLKAEIDVKEKKWNAAAESYRNAVESGMKRGIKKLYETVKQAKQDYDWAVNDYSSAQRRIERGNAALKQSEQNNEVDVPF